MAASWLPSVWQVLEFTNNSSQQLFISFHFHSFADDSLIYLHCRISEASSAVGKPEDCISVIGHWMSANRLKLNADKTELLWVGSRHNLDSLRGCTPSLQLFFSETRPSVLRHSHLGHRKDWTGALHFLRVTLFVSIAISSTIQHCRILLIKGDCFFGVHCIVLKMYCCLNRNHFVALAAKYGSDDYWTLDVG